MIDRVIRGANLALLTVASVGVLLLAVIVFGGVLWRYLLGSPLDFALPVSEYILLAIIFLAMSGTLLLDGHVRIDFVTDMMPKRVGLIVRQFGDAVGILVVALLGWLSIQHFSNVLRTGETDISILRVPLWATQWLQILGFTLMLATYILIWVQNWRRERPKTFLHGEEFL